MCRIVSQCAFKVQSHRSATVVYDQTMDVMTFFREKICNLLQISAGAALKSVVLFVKPATAPGPIQELMSLAPEICARLQAGESLFSTPIHIESTICVRERPQLTRILRDNAQPAQDSASPCH